MVGWPGEADTVIPCGAWGHAGVTLTFAFAGKGLLVQSSEPYVDRVILADIGIPDVCAWNDWDTPKPV